MKQDVLDALSGRFPARIPHKETLEHPDIIRHVTGLDVYEDTPRALALAWERLGIDIHAPLPTGNAPHPPLEGGTWVVGDQRHAAYGVYSSYMPLAQLTPERNWDLERVWAYDPRQDDFDERAALQQERAESSAFAHHFGDHAVRYALYFTTLLSWAVVTFGWEPFLLAVASDPERFDAQFWQPWATISRKRFEVLAQLDDPVLFCHDHLAMATGPILAPSYLETYILSRYEWIMAPALAAGKRIVFVCDGNLEMLLERLLSLPLAGLMAESPATPFSRILATWGEAGRGFSGGIDTNLLTNGTPEQVTEHTREVMRKGRNYPGFILAASGQLPRNIPLDNLLAYFSCQDALDLPPVCRQ